MNRQQMEQLDLERFRREWERQGGTRGTLRQARKQQGTIFPEWREGYSKQHQEKMGVLRERIADATKSQARVKQPRTERVQKIKRTDVMKPGVVQQSSGSWYFFDGTELRGPFPTREKARAEERRIKEGR